MFDEGDGCALLGAGNGAGSGRLKLLRCLRLEGGGPSSEMSLRSRNCIPVYHANVSSRQKGPHV